MSNELIYDYNERNQITSHIDYRQPQWQCELTKILDSKNSFKIPEVNGLKSLGILTHNIGLK